MNSPTSSTPVLIVGAGLAGLSAAVHLEDAGAPFRLIERAPQPGGHAVTTEDEGFLFDRTGHLLHLRDEGIRERVLGWLGDRLVAVQRRSRVYSHGVYTRYPFQANTFGLPPRVAYECLMGFLAAQRSPPAREPDNFEDFCLAHFGEGIARHFMLPYNERLWGVSPREITAAWCQRFVPLPSVEDVVAGAVGLNDRELGYNASFLYPRRGIGELPAAMARSLRAPIELGRPLRALDWKNRLAHLDGETIAYDRLITTAPLDALGRLLVDPPPEVAAAFGALRCTGLHYLDVAIDAPLRRDFHWIYVPEARFPFYRVGAYSHFSPEVAPAGCSSLYVELADRCPPDMATLGPRVARHLVEMGLIGGEHEVRFMRPRAIGHAYVIYDHQYLPSLAVLRPFLDAHGITSTGRYGGWNYSSMEDALIFGREAARALL
jgi:protoporphyrinogen oxidase